MATEKKYPKYGRPKKKGPTMTAMVRVPVIPAMFEKLTVEAEQLDKTRAQIVRELLSKHQSA